MRPLFFTILTLILVSAGAPVLASGWNPLFFWRKAPPVQQDGTTFTPKLYTPFIPSKSKEPPPTQSSTVLSATGIMKRASVSRAAEVEKLITQRRRLNADMVVMRQKQRTTAAQLAALDKNKTYAPVNPDTPVKNPDGTTAETKKVIYVKRGIFSLPRVFTSFR